MKTNVWILVFVGLVLGACSTQKMTTAYVNDEVYGTPDQGATIKDLKMTSSSAKGTSVITAPDQQTAVKPASSTWQDDYSDYSYASRIDRFNSSDTSRGYFDDRYTGGNSAGQSNSPNFNISLGFGAGYGYFGPSFGLGWGYPYGGWDFYMGWGYPYYGWGYPYYPWGYPYYWRYPMYCGIPYCCNTPYNDYYYGYGGTPIVYSSGNYYGPRRTLHRTDGGSTPPNSRMASSQKSSVSPNDRATTPPVYSRNSQTETNALAASPGTRASTQERYRYTRPDRIQPAPNQRTTINSGRSERNTGTTQPSPRYIRPENINTGNRSQTQNYSSPVYRQPKTSQEYLAPRNQAGNERRSSGYSTPERSSSSFSTPSRTTGREVYSTPRRTENNNRSFSTPTQRSNESGSYSAPSRSSGSSGGSNYSAPSRSGGSSSPPSSGGNSGRRR
jgi:hypothetical protein